MMVLAHIGGVPVEEVLMPLLSGGVGVGMLISVLSGIRRRTKI